MSSSTSSNTPAKHKKKPSRSRQSSDRSINKHSRSHASFSRPKTEILINVYDLLPPGRFSTLLWTFGTALLHTGVVIKDREYAYGGHSIPKKSGVYYTPPLQAPPGGTFKCTLLHGFTYAPTEETNKVIEEVSKEFLGTSYNLLTNNCNHFTNELVKRLTGQDAPRWLNRAAGIGVALPCVVPREWVEPPDYEGQDGELLSDEGDDDRDLGRDEREPMLRRNEERPVYQDRRQSLKRASVEDLGQVGISTSEEASRAGTSGKGKGALRDTAGRKLPVAETAPPER